MMTIKLVDQKYREQFDAAATHPLQSWAWGEFREKQGQKVVRLGEYEKDKLKSGLQMTIHRIPGFSGAIGYVPRGGMPTREMVAAVKKETGKYGVIFVKFEPNVEIMSSASGIFASPKYFTGLGLQSGKELFTPNTFRVDLGKSEEELLAGMKPKTRYNIRLAERKGVKVKEDNSKEAFEVFQRLTEETTIRQGFLAHDRGYRELMWESMRKAGIARMLVARRSQKSKVPAVGGTGASQKSIIAVWVLFFFNGVGYYPYGASSSKYRNLMASNLVAWRALQLARKEGCRSFDFWGCLGPNPDESDPWYGFHRFKKGYGGELVSLAGSWDLVLRPGAYAGFRMVDRVRWWWLKKIMPTKSSRLDKIGKSPRRWRGRQK